jgi:hypothetical protein
MPEELFAERVGAVPYKPQGLVFKRFGPEHIGAFPYNPDWPIELAVDPGQHTYAIEVVQWSGEIVRVIDEIYVHDTIAQDIIPLAMARPWWPHIKQNAGVIDNAGKQHNANKSAGRDLARRGGRLPPQLTYVFIDDGINAHAPTAAAQRRRRRPVCSCLIST